MRLLASCSQFTHASQALFNLTRFHSLLVTLRVLYTKKYSTPAAQTSAWVAFACSFSCIPASCHSCYTVLRLKLLTESASHACYARCPGCSACWWSRRTSLALNPRSRQARRSFWRPLPHHRYHSFQLRELRPAPCFCSHSVQSSKSQPPHPCWLVSADGAR